MKARFVAAPVVAAIAAIVVAGCGGGGGGGGGGGSNASSSPYGGAVSKSAPAPVSGATTISLRSGPLGSFLVDSKGMTLYLFQKDKGSMSTCSGACAQFWPPLTTKAKPQAGTGVKASLLGTTKRSDGSTEVTYAGHPLYYFAGDRKAGDLNGQGLTNFGAPWYVLGASGKQITG